jgi:hypothetical protein
LFNFPRGFVPDQAPKEWGIYVYYAADVPAAAMRRAAKLNLLKLADVGSNDHVGITAMLDVTNEDTQFYLLPPQPEDADEWVVYPSKVSPNLDSANTDTIREFFQWSVQNCPARQIAFVFYGHGYAIDDFDPRLEPGAAPVPEQQSDGHAADAIESDSGEDAAPAERSAEHFAQSRNLPLKLIFDSTYNQVLNNNQVADVIRDCAKSLPADKKLAILGFDCCNMAMAEVLCEMEGCAEIAVAAQTGLPFQSWVSQRMLQKLLRDPPDNPYDFVEDSVKDFIKIFAQQSSTYVALSACNLKLCNELERAAKGLADALSSVAHEALSRAAIFNSVKDTVCFDPDGFIDLDCFCGFLSQDLANHADVVAACASVRKVLKKDKFVLATEFAPNFPNRRISLSTGLSIWFPPWIEDPGIQIDQKQQSIEYFHNGYGRTKFARATGWDKFLSRLLTENQGNGNTEAEMAGSWRGGSDQLGKAYSSIGRPPDPVGRGPSPIGKPPDPRGRPPDPQGRGPAVGGPAGPGGPGGEHGAVTTCCTTREAGVVVRASVEAFGPAGDTELTVNVKWPAAALGAASWPCPVGTDHATPAKPAKVLEVGNQARLVARRPPELPKDEPEGE